MAEYYKLKNYVPFEEEKISILSLVCLVRGIPFNDDNSFYEEVNLQNGVFIRRKKSIGNFLSLVKDYDLLKAYQHIKVFHSENEMTMFCNDKVLFEYRDDDFLKNIDIIGQYIWIPSEKQAFSGVEIREDTVNNLYFVNFSAYVLKDTTTFSFEDNEITMTYDKESKIFKIIRKEKDVVDAPDDLLLEIRNISKGISYPYVLYILKNLPRDSSYQLTNCIVLKHSKK